MSAFIILLLASFGFINCTFHYDGYKVYNVIASTTFQSEFLLSLQNNNEFDFWSKINKISKPVTIMASPRVQRNFERYLKANNFTYNIEIGDVESSILNEKAYHLQKKSKKEEGITFDQYLRHDEINAYLEQVAADNPDIVKLINIGKSYQNRTINLVQISIGKTTPPRPIIFVEGGIHAREWIAPAVAMYFINQLVENSSNWRYIASVDWIILPTINPDGYEYTWIEDRLWRKTLSPGVICDGADGNRNFGFHWMEQGASSNECSETYAGKEAFSEIEARNLRDFLAEVQDNVKAYLTLHSYGPIIIYPWSYRLGACAPNQEELQSLGDRVGDVIASVGTARYDVGCSSTLLYPAAGCSDDWAMGDAGIDIVYVFELPGGGRYGFDLPPERILPVAVETFEGFKIIHDYIL